MLQYSCSVSKVHIGKWTWWLPIVFRVVDSSGKDGNEHLLTAYFYMEGDAKKGGNIVASMLIDYLH